MGDFTGFPADALAFFAELEANNSRPWWLANKARFDDSIGEPMQAMLDELEPSFGAFRVFRMNRDVRFSNDKSPYKTAHAAMSASGAVPHYVQLNANGLFVGGGIYHPARDQLARLRAAVADDVTGRALETAIATVRKAGVDVVPGHEPPLATAPRGFDRDHPRIELLRWKGCIASRDLGAPKWLHTARAAKEVAKAWSASAPLMKWLDEHVGPSELEPPPRRGAR